jgi:hypothetical protein
MSNAGIVDTAVDTTAVDMELSTRRLNVMRFGYAFHLYSDVMPSPLPRCGSRDGSGRSDWQSMTAGRCCHHCCQSLVDGDY